MVSVTASTGSAAERSAVGIIASAGGIPALLDLLPALPPSIPFPIIIAQHLPAALPSNLPAILAYRVALPVKWAEAGERPRAGTVYLSPPGCEVAVRQDGFAITPLPPFSSGWLACPDILLRSLAERYGAGAVGIVLSGMLAAGIAGLRAIRDRGGVIMAQTVGSASFFDMPVGAIDLGKAELVLSPTRMAEALVVLAQQWEPAGVHCRGVIYSDPQWLGSPP